MSKEQLKYLKKQKREKIIIIISQISILVSFLFIWELLSKYNIINPFIFSSPTKILKTIKDLYLNYNLLSHILTTLEETLIAFTLGIIEDIYILNAIINNDNIMYLASNTNLKLYPTSINILLRRFKMMFDTTIEIIPPIIIPIIPIIMPSCNIIFRI